MEKEAVEKDWQITTVDVENHHKIQIIARGVSQSRVLKVHPPKSYQVRTN